MACLQDKQPPAVRRPRPGMDGAVTPLALSLVGVLVAAALGIRLVEPLTDADERPGGPRPALYGPELVPPFGCGAGGLLLRQCRSFGRSYALYVPRGYDPERRYPLVVSLDGGPADASAAMGLARLWGSLADQLRCLVVAPELQSCDEPGRPADRLTPLEREDLAGIKAILDELAEDRDIDAAGTFLVGWSRSSRLAHSLAVEQGDRFAGFAAAGATFPGQLLDGAEARRQAGRLPVLLLDVSAGDSAAQAARAADFFEFILGREGAQVWVVVTRKTVGPPPVTMTIRPVVSGRLGPVRGYAWDFGRLATGLSHQKMHKVVIRREGAYPIKLTVTDALGREHSTGTTLTIGPPKGLFDFLFKSGQAG